MGQAINIGIIGDFDPDKPSHLATNDALNHAAQYLSVEVDISWLPTPALMTLEGQKRLERCNGIWASPGSPYQSMEGALKGIQLSRETNRPFFGT